MAFGLYLTGLIVLLLVLAIGANVPAQWIGVGVAAMAGLGLLAGVTVCCILLSERS